MPVVNKGLRFLHFFPRLGEVGSLTNFKALMCAVSGLFPGAAKPKEFPAISGCRMLNDVVSVGHFGCSRCVV